MTTKNELEDDWEAVRPGKLEDDWEDVRPSKEEPKGVTDSWVIPQHPNVELRAMDPKALSVQTLTYEEVTNNQHNILDPTGLDVIRLVGDMPSTAPAINGMVAIEESKVLWLVNAGDSSVYVNDNWSVTFGVPIVFGQTAHQIAANVWEIPPNGMSAFLFDPASNVWRRMV